MGADFDIAIVGSGFGGSLLAMIARRLGRSVILLERERHPRFAIGESSTPLANLLIEELACRFDLPRLAPLTKWGTWQAAYPQVACGLKRGFTFYHHRFGEAFVPRPDRSNELLVAASPNDRIADTHWYRPDVDHFLMREAQALGAEYLDETYLDSASLSPASVALAGTRHGQAVNLRARFVVDATGPRGFLHRALGLPESPFPNLPPTQALFSHFRGVRRWDETFNCKDAPPYPVDDAAVHHVFEGGWIWALRFNNGITSVGVAATERLAAELKLSGGGPAWERLLARLPSVREQMADARIEFPFVHLPRISFRSNVVAGLNWALLPSAAGFIDPLLSTGFPLTLLGLERLAGIFERDWNTTRLAHALSAYEEATRSELETTEQLIAALYANFSKSENFNLLTLLYFAAASFTETARRLERAELAGESFLLAGHPEFGPAFRRCVQRAQAGDATTTAALRREVLEAIAPVDVAGLANSSQRNWFPVVAEDLFAARGKLGASHEEIVQLLARCGFAGS